MNIKKLLTLIWIAPASFLFLSCSTNKTDEGSNLVVSHLSCQYEKHPLGIDEKQPQLSWELQSEGRNNVQQAYQLLVATSIEDRFCRSFSNICASLKLWICCKRPLIAVDASGALDNLPF